MKKPKVRVMIKDIISSVVRRTNNLQPMSNNDNLIYTIDELNGIYEANQKLIELKFGNLLTDDFRSKKTSDTIFILGSGPSINELTHREVKEIQRNDSIGFNFWLVHDLIPTFYCFQHTNYGEGAIYEIFKEKAEAYLNTPIIVRGSMLTTDLAYCEGKHETYLKNHSVYFLNEYPVHSTFSGDIRNLIRYIENLGLLNHGKISRFTPKFRGTLGLLISFSYQMGYKNIVLCGVDMNDSTHFYDSGKYSNIREVYKLPPPGASDIETMQSITYSKNTVGDYVQQLSGFMNSRSNVKIWVQSSNSALSKFVPIWQR